MPEKNPTIGDPVHYVIGDADLAGHSVGEERPAVITRTWPGVVEHVQMTVFLDGANDAQHNSGSPLLIKSSCTGSSGPVPGSWHYPERT